MLKRDSRGGLASGEVDFGTLGGDLAHSSLTVAESRDPRILESGRVDLIRDGAWISE